MVLIITVKRALALSQKSIWVITSFVFISCDSVDYSFVEKTKDDPRSHTNQHEPKHSCLELDPTFEAMLRASVNLANLDDPRPSLSLWIRNDPRNHTNHKSSVVRSYFVDRPLSGVFTGGTLSNTSAPRAVVD